MRLALFASLALTSAAFAHGFVMPSLPVPATPAGAQQLLQALTCSESPAAHPGDPLPFPMRGEPVTAPAGSVGRLRLFEYTNDGVDTAHQYNACGQAAISTALTGVGAKPEDPSDGVMKDVYAHFPPDILFGKFGTSWKQVQRGLTSNHVKWRWVEGEDALMDTLRHGMLAMVMLDIGATVDEGWGSLGAHWTVIYAADQRGVYLSNWPRDGHCTWANLRRGWDTVLTRAFYGAAPWQHHQWFLVPWIPR